MKQFQQIIFSANCWSILLGLALLWSPQAIQANSFPSEMDSNGQVTGFLLNKQDGSALLHLNNGDTFCESEFPNDIRIRTSESGNHQSLRFTITGPGGTWTNTENVVPYDSKQFWPTPGTYTVRAELYSHDNLGGTRYDNETISFTVTDCNAIPTLNCNNGDFVWEGSTRLIYSSNTMEAYNLPSVFNNATSVVISEVLATDSYSNRGNVTQADEELKLVFRRNGNVTGMSDYTPDLQDRVETAVFQGSLPTVQLNGGADEVLVIHPGNSQFGRNITNSPNSLDINGLCLNAVVVIPCTGDELPTATSTKMDESSFGANDGMITFNFGAVPQRTHYEFSIDGGATWPGRAEDTDGSFKFSNLAPGLYQLYIRWGDDDCPTFVGNRRINAAAQTVDCPTLNANIGDACNDGNANTSNDVVQANCTCAGTPNPPTGCDATYSVNGRVITVSNLTGAIKAVKIIDNQWNTLYSCDDWGTNPCGGSESYTVPSCGTYSVQIQTYADWSTPICNEFETFQVDTDCGATVDCPALNANIGDACNDGNPNTTNDHVQANCTCAGTPVGPVYDCPALSANIGDSCNDGNPNTTNDVVTASCGCAGTPTGPTTCDATYRVEGNKIIIEGLNAAINSAKILDSAWGTEAECSDWSTACGGMLMATVANGTYFVQIQTYADWSTPLCDIFEEVTVGNGGPTFDCPALSANIGDSCNDGNPNTNNDTVQGNCTCAGTPTGPTTCDATYRVEGDKIIIEGLNAAINSAKILDNAWGTIAECSDWTTTCGGMLMATVPNGDYFVQIQTYADWSTPLCDIFESVTVSGGSGGCDNVNNGGSIAGDETGCGSYNPGPITSASLPSGGSGAVEYLWLSSTTGCPRFISEAISGATSSTYDPGTITQTTYYVRCSRRAGCTDWTVGESNCVVKTVDDNCNTECANRTATNTKTDCGTGENYGFYANNLVSGVSEGARYSISNANFVEYTDGTARYTARATSNDDSGVRWDLDVTFSGRTSTPPAGSPKVNSCNAAGNDYYYYTSTNGTLTGRGDVAGARLNITRTGEAFQVGTGANLQEGNRFGASGWLAYTITSHPNNSALTLRAGVGMDINIRLDGSPTACESGNGGNGSTCANRTASNSTTCSAGISYGIWTAGTQYTISNGWFIEYTDGTAKFTGQADGLGAIDITFTGRTTNGTPQFGSCLGTVSTNDWYYYSSFSGTIGHLTVSPRGNEFHVGTGGNNQNAGVLGASGWWVASDGTNGDINILLDGSPNACNMGGSTFDCPALGADIGDACDDGNANTENDTVQNDCSCAGTPVGGGCNINISVDGNSITVTGAVGPFPNVGIFDDFGNTIYECHAFNGGCPTVVTVDNLAPGVYWVSGRVVDSDWVTVLCEAFEDPVVGGNAPRLGSNNGINIKDSKDFLTENGDFNVFPNPAQSEVNVSLVGYEGKDVQIQMIDQLGKIIKVKEIDNAYDTKYTIPLNGVNTGIYTIRILSDGIKPLGKKMIVNKVH